MNSCIIIHYNEIALKGGNRAAFEMQLVKNVRALSCAHFFAEVKRISGRILIRLHDVGEFDGAEIDDALSRVYGVSGYLWMECVPLTLDAMQETALVIARSEAGTDPHATRSGQAPQSRGIASALPRNDIKKSFAVRSRRSSPLIPFPSDVMNRSLGSLIQEKTGWKVDLENPEVTFHVEMVEKNAYVGTEFHKGAGGLPVGISGNVLVLLSGGIDSPVAASMLQKRGCLVSGIHFHNAPYTSYASVEKVKELARVLAGAQDGMKLFLVPFTDLQKEIVKHCDQKYRVLLYRRFMIRIAEAIAKKNRIRALATGESVGQVASQTIENIDSVNAIATMPVLRPVIGFDKEEIIQVARRIGTFDISILPHEDCCTYFMPRKPATKSRPSDLAGEERGLDVERLVEETIAKIETTTI